MSKRFQNLNKYRNAVGVVSKKEHWFADLPIATSSSESASLIQANDKWIAVKWAGTGNMGLLPLDQPGKDCATKAKLFHAHGAPVSDWQFSPFDDHLLATGAEDYMVKIWKIPDYGNDVNDSDPTCLTTLTTSSRRVDMVRFHPTADQILTTLGNDGKKVSIWDIEKSACAYDLVGSTAIHSFSWKADAALLATTGKDVVQIWDPRAEQKLVQSGRCHEGIKNSRTVWLKDSHYIFTVGMDKIRNRQYGVFDTRNLSNPFMMQQLDASTGTLLPLYDEDTETMYLISRGDATVRSLQFSDISAGLTLTENMSCGTNASLIGATLIPKRSLDVMHTEVARLLTVTNNAVIPISYQIPRKQYIDFHADLFPDTKGNVAALSSHDWFAGKTCNVATVSLDPSKRIQISQSSSSNGTPETKDVSVAKSSLSSTSRDTSCLKTMDTPISPSNSDKIQQELPQQPSSASPVSCNNLSSETQGKRALPSESTTESTNSTCTTAASLSTTIKNVPSKFGATNSSIYKYISSKTYHPSTHYDDLNGLNFNKSGTTELIQANAKFIAIPLSGPGGRIAIVATNSSKGRRLPVHIPSVLTGSDVTYFQFDPFDPHILATVSDDNKIRLFHLPEHGLEDDLSESAVILQDPHMDKVNLLAYHPTSRNILASASQDLGKPTLRIWSTSSSAASPKLTIHGVHKDAILAMVWRPDGKAIATVSKDRQLRIVEARTGRLLAQTKAHEGIRPNRLLWLDDQRFLVSVGFGLGSMREILLFDTLNMTLSSKPLASKSIDVSPSIMAAYFDRDCRLLFVAGKGDRIIHTFEFENNSTLTPLTKLEFGSLQQGFAFLPKRLCNVKELEVAKLYRLTPTTIEPVGIYVPRARPEFFQDDIFIPTLDIEYAVQSHDDWFQSSDKTLSRISLRPENMTPLSEAPPPEHAAQAKAKFESGKQQVSEEQQRQATLNRMYATAKDVDQGDERRTKYENQQDSEDVAEDEWSE